MLPRTGGEIGGEASVDTDCAGSDVHFALAAMSCLTDL